jgi:hypothetical protein
MKQKANEVVQGQLVLECYSMMCYSTVMTRGPTVGQRVPGGHWILHR